MFARAFCGFVFRLNRKVFHGKFCDLFMTIILLRDHPFKTSACLRGGGVSPCADGQRVTVHKDVHKNHENLPTS